MELKEERTQCPKGKGEIISHEVEKNDPQGSINGSPDVGPDKARTLLT